MVRFSFLLMLSILTLVSCGDDDDAGDSFMEDSLVGTWNITTYDTDLSVAIQGFGADAVSSTLVSSDATVTFTSGGTWSSMGEAEVMITEGDSTYTETQILADSGSWSVNSQVVTMTSSDPDDATFTVEEFTVTSYNTDARVALNSNVDESVTDPFFGLMVTTTGTVDLVLEQ